MGWIIEAADVYHAHPALSSHGLKTLLKSPQHFYSHYVLKEDREQTPAMKMGSLLHSAILEPDDFRKHFRVPPKCDKRTKEGKAVWEAFTVSLLPNQTVITEDEAKTLHGVSHAILKHPLAHKMLQGGHAERSGYTTLDDLSVKFRADYAHDDGFIIDLKFVHDASYSEFQRTIVKYGYDVQAAWYRRMGSELWGHKEDEIAFSWIAIEKTPPFALAVYNADNAILRKGHGDYTRALEIYRRCHKDNTWPGYGDEAQLMTLPRWVR